jgi:hypothetical protein
MVEVEEFRTIMDTWDSLAHAWKSEMYKIEFLRRRTAEELVKVSNLVHNLRSERDEAKRERDTAKWERDEAKRERDEMNKSQNEKPGQASRRLEWSRNVTAVLLAQLEMVTEEWEDTLLPDVDASINAAFMREASSGTRAQAIRLVGARKSRGTLEALVNWLLVRIEAKEAVVTELKAILIPCGTNRLNHHTCGVCRKHFEDCEAEVHYTGWPNPGPDDGPFKSCAGARVRKALQEKML